MTGMFRRAINEDAYNIPSTNFKLLYFYEFEYMHKVNDPYVRNEINYLFNN